MSDLLPPSTVRALEETILSWRLDPLTRERIPMVVGAVRDAACAAEQMFRIWATAGVKIGLAADAIADIAKRSGPAPVAQDDAGVPLP